MKNKPLYDAALLLLKLRSPDMTTLVNWMWANANQHEKVVCHHWTDDRFYVEVKDDRFCYPDDLRIFLTVDAQGGVILWNHQHGNCGVRSSKWKTLFSIQYPKQYHDRQQLYAGQCKDGRSVKYLRDQRSMKETP